MDSKEKIANLLIKIAITILMLWAGYMANTVATLQRTANANSTQIQVMKSTEFSISDGYNLEQKMETLIFSSVGEIKDCLNKIQQNRQCD
ncbi:hypothetical protein LCGC14_2923760 [marine sediment metagenome]|uniref:Uncharacterized protein n=1 Tax=marine sediment metagenome TaxID=412755 RepID=A0A0F8XN62_9ZZZZ